MRITPVLLGFAALALGACAPATAAGDLASLPPAPAVGPPVLAPTLPPAPLFIPAAPVVIPVPSQPIRLTHP